MLLKPVCLSSFCGTVFSNRFGITWGWVNDWIFLFEWTVPKNWTISSSKTNHIPGKPIWPLLALFSLLCFILLPLLVKQRPPMYLKHITTASICHLPWISHQLKPLLTPPVCFWHCFDTPFDSLQVWTIWTCDILLRREVTSPHPVPLFPLLSLPVTLSQCPLIYHIEERSQRTANHPYLLLLFISSASVWQTSGSTPKIFLSLKNLSHPGPKRVNTLNHCATLVQKNIYQLLNKAGSYLLTSCNPV